MRAHFLIVTLVCASGCLDDPVVASRAARTTIAGHPIGRLTSSGNGDRRSYSEYDRLGRVVRTDHAGDGRMLGRFDWFYGFARGGEAPHGNVLRRMRMPDGEEVTYAYDAGGGEQRVVAGGAVVVDRVVRDAHGRTTEIEYGNGAVIETQYDPVTQRLLSSRTVGPTGAVLQHFSYSFDDEGNVTAISDHVRPHLGATYSYDSLDQLVSMTSGGATWTWSYDGIGNLTVKEGVVQTYGAAGKPHAIASSGDRSYAYDANGNATEIRQGATVLTRLTWNSENMAVRLEQVGAIKFRKWFVGESMWKKEDTAGDTITYYLPSVRVEIGATERLRKYYGAHAERDPDDGGRLKFYHADHLGSSTLVTDDTGAVVRRATYEPYGEDREVSTSTFAPKYQFHFKEKEQLDASTYVYEFGARLYNPATGRWLSADVVDDDQNRYAYVHNNPLRYVDPTGHSGQETSGWRGYVSGVVDGAVDTVAGIIAIPRLILDPMYAAQQVKGAVGALREAGSFYAAAARDPRAAVRALNNLTAYDLGQLTIAVAPVKGPRLFKGAGRASTGTTAARTGSAASGNAARRRMGVPVTPAEKIARKTDGWSGNGRRDGRPGDGKPTCVTSAVQNCIRGQLSGYDTDVYAIYPTFGNQPGHAVARFRTKGEPDKYLSWGRVYSNLDDIAKDAGYGAFYFSVRYEVPEAVRKMRFAWSEAPIWPDQVKSK